MHRSWHVLSHLFCLDIGIACGLPPPQGRLLAGASSDAPGFQLWDVATGTAVPVAVGQRSVCVK